MNYLLGLDNGGTTTKAAIFDTQGREIAVASMETRSILPKPNYVERDMEEMWQANCAVIRKVLENAGISGSQVAAVAVCGHGKGLYLWGKSNRPVRNGIISADNRAYEYPERWRKDGTAEKVFAISQQNIMACQPVCLLAWLQDHEPECIGEIQWIFEAKDYVRFRLTGEARAERTDYSGANLVDLRTGNYNDELLKLFGLEGLKDALPPLCNALEVCGHITEEAAALTGLAVGTPVSGGMFDIDACAIAAGITSSEDLCMIAGTWSINEYIRKTSVTDGSVLMNSFYAMPGYYLVEECSPTSAGNNEWFLQTLMAEYVEKAKANGQSVYGEINRMVEALGPKAATPIFLPFLLGSNVHPNAKGCFIGMDSYHTRAHLIMSVYEGVAFSHRYHMEKLLRSRDEPVRAIRLAGGAARSEVWTQIFADVTGFPVERVVANETGALGCAISAAVAIGLYPTVEDAVAAMCQIKPAIQPRPGMKAYYDEKFALYCRFIDALDPVWTDYQHHVEQVMDSSN